MIRQRRQGRSLMQIAIALNAGGVQMPRGGARWGKQSVRRVLTTKYARDIEDDMDP